MTRVRQSDVVLGSQTNIAGRNRLNLAEPRGTQLRRRQEAAVERGSSPLARRRRCNDGERDVLRRLRDELPDDWHVVSNFWAEQGRRQFECDALVVCPEGWAYLIETKAWLGRIRGNNNQWETAGPQQERLGHLQDEPCQPDPP